MKKLVFTNLVDAVLNRIGGMFSNMLLRRLAMHVARSEADELASTEEHLKVLRDHSHDAAVRRIESYLEAALGDDPSFEIGTSFSRQLLADSYETDTPGMRGEPSSNGKRRGRKPKALTAPVDPAA